MAEYKQRTTTTTKRDEPEIDEQPTDQRDAELDEDVACCLSDIDEALDEQSEDDAAEAYERTVKAEAKRLYNDLQDRLYNDLIDQNDYWIERQEWQAKYGHMFESSCCGSPVFDD
jgi:hypothetical protein